MKKRKYRKTRNNNLILLAIFSITFLFIGLAYANTNQVLNISGTARVGNFSTPSLSLSHSKLGMLIGDEETIIAYTSNTTEQVVWSSSNPEYATVDSTGKVIGIASGTTIITATCGNLTATCTVNVSNGQDGPIIFDIIDDQTVNNHIYYSIWNITNNTNKKIMSWSFDAVFPEDSIYNSSTFEQLGIKIDGNTFSGGELEPGEILTVVGSMDAPDGYMLEDYLPVRIKNIHVVYEDGTVENPENPSEPDDPDEPDNPDEPDEPIIEVPAYSVQIDKYYVELNIGDTTTITATPEPANSTDEMVWTSENPNIATVENGVVTAISPGDVTIKVTCGSNVSAQCQIKVLQGAQENPTITLNQTQLDMIVGDNFTLVATVNPSNMQGAVNWISNNTNIVTVNNGVVTAINPGQTTITASIGNISTTCNVNVTSAEVALENIILDKTNINLLVGENTTVIATKVPENATGDIVWESNDSNIASVDQNGNITANSVGTTTIVARVGDISAQCTVKVTEPTSSEDVELSVQIVPNSYQGSEIWNGNIAITNNSNVAITSWSITLDLPTGTTLNCWSPPAGCTVNGLTITGGNLGSGNTIRIEGGFKLPDGYDWADYINKNLTITVNSVE